MVIFHSYVSLPDGTFFLWTLHQLSYRKRGAPHCLCCFQFLAAPVEEFPSVVLVDADASVGNSEPAKSQRSSSLLVEQQMAG